jgi:hypothetical protein
MGPDNIGFILIGLVILWIVWRSRLRSRTPEAQLEQSERQAARAEALADLPDGWELGHGDRERFGAGSDGVAVYGAVATGPEGAGVLGLGLSEPDALRAAVRGVRGEVPLSDAWAPPVADLTTATSDVAPDVDVQLPMGWTLVVCDHERFSATRGSVSTYGALALGPGGRRALAVALDRATASERLVDRIEGRLAVSDSGAIRCYNPPA